MTELTRAITVNGIRFIARMSIDPELLRWNSSVVRVGIEDGLEVSLHEMCKERFGVGSLVRHGPDLYEWLSLSACPSLAPGGREFALSH